MAYIIDEANVMKEKQISTCSILVKDNKVDYIGKQLKRLKFMRMNVSNYLLTPGHIMMNFSFANKLPFLELKEEMIKNYLSKGCTTLLVICEVENERDLVKKVKETQHFLLNSPIDYFIGIRIPLKILTPSLLIACRRLKLPAVIVDIGHVEELIKIPWGWIRESYFSFNLPIIPNWKVKGKPFFQGKKSLELWNEIMTDNRIPTIPSCPSEGVPLTLNELKKIGIYPSKGDIRVGGSLDYNLYDLTDIGYSVEQLPILDYHNHIPKITMHKGKFIKVDSQIYFHSGLGNYCIVKKPGNFASTFDYAL